MRCTVGFRLQIHILFARGAATSRPCPSLDRSQRLFFTSLALQSAAAILSPGPDWFPSIVQALL